MDVERMVAYGILKDLSNDRQRYSDYRPGPDAKRILDEDRGAVDMYAPTIRKVTGLFKDLKPETLELISTLHFIDRRLRATGTGDAPRDQVLAEFHSVKADKFEKWKVEDAFDAMRRVGILGTQPRVRASNFES